MILRFINEKTGDCVNVDTTREEYSEGMITCRWYERHYVAVSNRDFEKILAELNFNCYDWRETLPNDAGDDRLDPVDALEFYNRPLF